MKVSLIIPSFKRATLLDLGLHSITKQPCVYPLEIIVVNDGIEDETESVCKKYSDTLNVQYYFSGQRNKEGIKSRVPAWAINIGVRKCTGDIIVLSSPEIFHLNAALNYVISPLLNDKSIVTSIKHLYFDKVDTLLPVFQANRDVVVTQTMLNSVIKGMAARRMPFLMGMYKSAFMGVGGYDEDFTGYAGDDNDFVDRIMGTGHFILYTDASILHLYHGGTNDGEPHYDNPAWVHNFNLWQGRKGVMKRNEGREWGVL